MSVVSTNDVGYNFFGRTIIPQLGPIEETGAGVIVHAISIEAPFSKPLAKRLARKSSNWFKAIPQSNRVVWSYPTPVK